MPAHHSNQPANQGRRNFLKNTGQLLIGFSLTQAPFAVHAEGMPFATPRVEEDSINAWIRIDAEGNVTVLTGKTELGQGIKTALMQMAAEELDVNMKRIRIIIADTGQTSDERYTAGSASIEGSGRAIRMAAAEARKRLLDMAAGKLNAPVSGLTVKDGIITATATGQSISYGALLNGKSIEGEVTGKAPLKDPSTYTLVGTAYPREDIVAMATGQPVYVQDLRMPGMLHARILRPPVYGATLTALPENKLTGLAGIIKLVRNGSFVGIVAQEEYQAVKALRVLQQSATWNKPPLQPMLPELFNKMAAQTDNGEIVEKNDSVDPAIAAAAVQHEAVYKRPYQMHGSMGPSCAMAQWKDDQLMVWSHTQGVYPLRSTLADLLSIPESKIRVMAVPGAGCYGHNGADDVGADAALLAMAVPGKPVRVQWMREDEHTWEPYGSAMLLRLKGGLDAQGNLLALKTELWSDTHIARPGGRAGHFIAGRDLEKPFTFSPGRFSGGSYRNAVPLYNTPRQVILYNYKGPLRTSALRSLGAYANIFALESFIDELAHKAGKDPAAFRMQYLNDDRAKAVIQLLIDKTNWKERISKKGAGLGIAFAQYKNEAAYFAIVAEVQVDKTARQYRLVKLTGAIEAGQAINIDGIKNQTAGGMIQSASWTMLESVRYNATGIQSRNWDTYPILRFNAVPDTEVFVINRPELPPLGAGEAAQGPVAAAIANAIFHATGTRLRELPLKL
ncbi:xanthine dehydrogenase family protein molybdopterin-binding subunit [Pseudoflavitalea sp. X16]|uniref:xanthine dehydrogenase family protein molybdopterin-binding subunit n=1 Tax=Paraflavitalea devenefica TaxID=2716334 RepID=UPI00142228D7|nr:molybdopterin cofactor-binding domain-containing protein [Paraflavitalea devenefica]NII27656.1 xanthine dehydrogenase family protein molybdopterin-binding subunit [Paraflavitalea devenefica]